MEFLNSCLKYNPDERLGWQQLAEHGYIQHTDYQMVSENTDPSLENALYLSTIKETTEKLAVFHQEVLKEPYRWMRQNKDKTHVLNVRTDE